MPWRHGTTSSFLPNLRRPTTPWRSRAAWCRSFRRCDQRRAGRVGQGELPAFRGNRCAPLFRSVLDAGQFGMAAGTKVRSESRRIQTGRGSSSRAHAPDVICRTRTNRHIDHSCQDGVTAMSKPKSTESRKNPKEETYWQFVERTAADVATWPAWKLGGTSSRDPQTPPDKGGDRKNLK